MNVEEKLRAAKSQFPLPTVDKDRFIERFWSRVGEPKASPKIRPTRRKRVIWSATAILAGGIIVSPLIASAVQKVPVVHLVLDWVKGTAAAPFVKNVQMSATDRGITMTITDVLYGPSDISFGYTVSSSSVDMSALGGPSDMKFFVNGKQVHIQGSGDANKTAFGYEGVWDLTNGGTQTKLPSTFHLQLVVHKIGWVHGTWVFSIPVSRKNMKPEQTFLPMTTHAVGADTVTIKEIRLYPTGGMADYDITTPIGEKPSLNMALFNQDKAIMDTLVGTANMAESHAVQDGVEIWSYREPFRLPIEISKSGVVVPQMPTSIIVIPSSPTPVQPIRLPLANFPITLDYGVFGKVVITGIHASGEHLSVLYQTTSRTVQIHALFRVVDVTHPSWHYSGASSQPNLTAGAHHFTDVYDYQRDISSDKFVLEYYPPSTSVFTVPLKNSAK